MAIMTVNATFDLKALNFASEYVYTNQHVCLRDSSNRKLLRGEGFNRIRTSTTATTTSTIYTSAGSRPY